MMNTHIARKQLNSRTFDAEDLQQATNLLATWLIQASHGKTARLSLQVTATIWGFARSEGETECADLRERIEVSSEGASVKLASHNVIEVTFLPLPVVPETPIPSIRRVFESVMPFEHLQKSRVITFRVHLKGESGEKRDHYCGLLRSKTRNDLYFRRDLARRSRTDARRTIPSHSLASRI